MAKRTKRSASLAPELAVAIDRAAAERGESFSGSLAATAARRLRIEAGAVSLSDQRRPARPCAGAAADVHDRFPHGPYRDADDSTALNESARAEERCAMGIVGNDRTAGWANVEDVVLYVGSNRAPSDSDWSAHCDFISLVSRKTKLKSVLVVDASSGPNAKQRAQLGQLTAGLGLRVALVTPSLMVRGAATAISWINGTQLKTFSPGPLHPAFQYLGLTEQVATRVGTVHAELESALLQPVP